VFVTIVCLCGHHNQVADDQLEVAHCLRCHRLLLPASRLAPLPATVPVRP
jgi:hypothetical protein